jgi:tetratricopeptide (TPR) repeat protein
MHRSFLLGLTLMALIASPVAPHAAPGGGGGGGYQPQTPDTGYDDMKADTQRRQGPSELAIGADLVKQGKFSDAIPHLEAARKAKPRDVTTLTYLGFAHRMAANSLTGAAQTAEYNSALDAYRDGLAISPDNKLLHEYLGKLYLLQRQEGPALDELKALQALCEAGCAERTALEQAIAANPMPATAK